MEKGSANYTTVEIYDPKVVCDPNDPRRPWQQREAGSHYP